MEVHHIKKLKDLQGKKIWEQVMIARRRKTNNSKTAAALTKHTRTSRRNTTGLPQPSKRRHITNETQTNNYRNSCLITPTHCAYKKISKIKTDKKIRSNKEGDRLSLPRRLTSYE